MKTPVERIIEALRNERATVVVGTGVSIMATGNAPCASWQGLLEHGISHCEQKKWWSVKEVETCRALIGIDRLPLAAQMIKDQIDKQGEHAFQEWLQDALTKLPVSNHEILGAVHDLDAPLITLNYDGLLERSSPAYLEPITWKDVFHCLQFLRGADTGKVLHLHGYYNRADTVILDVKSYADLLNSRLVEEFRNALSLTRTMIYVGCGGTFVDPHFEVFRKWVAEVCKGGVGAHYRLVRESELHDAQALHKGDCIEPIVYGQEYADLVPFLTELKPSRRRSAPEQPIRPVRPYLMSKPVLFGRDQKLDALVDAILADTPEPICISGPPGFGKSALMLSALHDARVESRFGPRRLFVRVDAAKTLTDVASMIANALNLVLVAHDTLKNAVLNELARMPTALAIDNLETVWEPVNQRDEVEDWLGQICANKDTVLIVTIRGSELPGHLGWQSPCGSLTPLAPSSARELFIGIAPEHTHDPGLPAVLGELDGWPLAIVLMAHQARGESSLEPVMRRWRIERGRMLSRGAGTDAATSLDISLSVSIESQRMTPSARGLLQFLGHLPAGLADADRENIGFSATDARRLIETGLTFREGGRLRLLPLIREYVNAVHPTQAADFAKLKSFYLRLCQSEGAKVGTAEGRAAVERLSVEVPNVDALVSSGVPEPQHAAAMMTWAKFVRYTGLGDAKLLTTALLAASEVASPKQRAGLIYAAGSLALQRSDHDRARALYQQALPLYQSIRAVLGEANCIKKLGDIALRRSDHDSARAFYEQARPLYQSIRAVLGEANCIKSLGDIALRRSDHDNAQALYEKARPLYQRVGAVLGEANCITSLGDIALRHNDHDNAGALYEKARSLYERVGAVLGEANCITSLGDIALRRSDHDNARTLYEKARPLYQRVGSMLGEANCIRSLGDIALQRRDHDNAQALYEQARTLYHRIGEVLGEANCIKSLGDIALQRSDRDGARALYQQACLLYRHVGNVPGEADCIRSLSDIAREHSDHARRDVLSAGADDLSTDLQSIFDRADDTPA
jgi:tetratricopeptide (TPR) repeat protein